MKRFFIVLFLVVAFGIAAILVFRNQIMMFAFFPTSSRALPGTTSETVEAQNDIAIVASNLTVPWGLVFLPDESILVTERSGVLRRIGTDGTTIQVPGVRHVGEGGLLGVALHPQFSENQLPNIK